MLKLEITRLIKAKPIVTINFISYSTSSNFPSANSTIYDMIYLQWQIQEGQDKSDCNFHTTKAIIILTRS